MNKQTIQPTQSHLQNNKRIAKNTMMLYIRQIIVTIVGLYTVRIVLNNLGVEDYGVYAVVGGIVAMLSFLTGTMSSATQRFFSFYLGQNNQQKLKQVFSVNNIIYLILVAIVFLLLETIGLWFIKNELSIPAGREDAVHFIFQFSILTFVANMLASPFRAAINAHEDMQIYAYLSILDVVLKLLVAYLLVYISFDKLKLYSVLLFVSSVIVTIVYAIICCVKYQECQFRKTYWDKSIFKEIMDFTGWTLFGQVTTMLRTQATTVLINQYFTPITVASRAIATQVTSQLNTFSSNFNASLYPPIIKSYSSGHLDEMYKLIYRGSKIAFFLMWVFALPMVVYMDEILTIWLKNVPERAVLFTRLALAEVLIQSISTPIMTAARAPGKMKMYELILGAIQIALFLIAWLVFSLGYPDYSVYFVIIGINILMFFVRLIIVKYLTGLPLKPFIFDVALRMFAVAVISMIIFVLLAKVFPTTLLYVVIVGTIGTAINCLAMLYLGFNKIDRTAITNMVISKLKRK